MFNLQPCDIKFYPMTLHNIKKSITVILHKEQVTSCGKLKPGSNQGTFV